MVRKTTGFTMVELMIAVAIVAILASIAIPVYNAQVPRMRLNGAARMVMGDLMTARMNAVKLNKTMNVERISNISYKISNTSSGGSYSETVNIKSHYSGVTLSFSNFAFSSRGTTNDSASHTVTLTNSAGSKQIVVNVAGQIKIN